MIEKLLPQSPHETILVIDANAGQNALIQAKEFHKNLNITGIIITKLDGSSKGGIIVGISNEIKIPIKAIGVGEKLQDLKVFNTKEFVDSVL